MGRGGVNQLVLNNAADSSFKNGSGVFPFFGLPRELRDSIYDDCLIFKRKFGPQYGIRLRGRRVVQPHLLLLNSQFRDEYLEQAQKKTCLVIVDRDHYHGEPLKLPSVMKYAHKLELHLALACDAADHVMSGSSKCKVKQELRMHRKWIGDICLQMKELDSIKVSVMLDFHEYISDCETHLLAEQYRLTNLEALTSLEIFHCDYYVGPKTDSASAWNFSKPKSLIMMWSAQKGILECVEHEERVDEAGR
ncbi:hypothetical protein B0A50_07834 [Salinomyces thailandicus]|uniref:Uncharacterized protein n=1 Tax=Salinomyces thailandicus TaxID=706561 RepID=A0A4U0TMF4_9PEZI|nr:hypothetical protein B0A50_07834 [Salinomyces thailandica]